MADDDFFVGEGSQFGSYTSSGPGIAGPNPGWGGGGSIGPGGGSMSQSRSEGSYIPDYPQSQFLQQWAQYAAQMAQAYERWAMDVYNKTDQITDQVVDQALATTEATGGLAANLLQRYAGQFQPLEDQLIRDANTYASPDRIASEMGSAQAGAQQAMDAASDNAIRDLMSYGIDPSSGRYDDLNRSYEAAAGAAAAAAGQTARRATEDRGRAMRSEAIKVGQQYPGQAINALNTGVASLRTASDAVGQRASAAQGLARIPAEYLNAALSLRYPPLGTGPSFSNSESRPPLSGGGGAAGGGGSKGGGSKPSGGGGGGQQQQRQPQQRQPGQGGRGEPQERDSWQPPGAPQARPQSAIRDVRGAPADELGPHFDAMRTWDPLGNYDFSNYYDDPYSDASGNEADPYTDWGWSGYDGGIYDDFYGDWENYADAAGNYEDPYSDWGWDGYDGGYDDYYGDYGYGDYGDVGGNEADPYTDWGWDASSDYSDYGGYDDYYGDYSDYSDYSDDYGYDYGDYGGDYSGDYYADYGDAYSSDFDYGYAGGGPVQPGNAYRGGKPRDPRMVPPQASPSGGRVQDDVNAQLSVDEFVVPDDVVKWKGQEYFQKLIETSRKNRSGGAAKGKPVPNRTGKPSFSTIGKP